MSELIQMRWHRKLENWALWYAGGESKGVGSAYDGTWGDGAPRPPQPLVGEAIDTDQLVNLLPDPQFIAVRACYVWTVGTLADRAAELGIHRDTLSDRITAARYRLEDLSEQRKAGAIRPPIVVAFA